MSTSRPTTRASAKANASRRGSRRAKPTKTRRGRGKRILMGLAITGLVCFLLGVGAFFVAYATISVPKPNEAANRQATIIYYADGKTELGRVSAVNRESVPLKQIPEAVRYAHLAAEDRDFYQNSGVSPSGILRGAWKTLRGGTTQSGSTITQQYVKNYFLTQDQTLSRKGREIILSIKIGKQQSKDEILENYLNTIYYGRGASGIQTAAKAYFNKDVSQLTPSEGAMLASVIKGPSFFDPGLGASQRANVEARWKYVMDGMVTQGWMTPEERAKQVFPKVATYRPAQTATGPNGFIVDAVKRELRSKLKLTDTDIDTGGFRITTTIDKKAQDAAVKAISERLPKGKGTETLRVGLTSIKPGDGAVVAMYGGADYSKNQFNTSTMATMQAGSTFKIFTLLAALSQDQPISTKTRFNGKTPQYFDEFKDAAAATPFLRRGGVRNFGRFPGEPFGNIDLRKATGHSVNTVYAKLNIEVGPEATKAAAIAAGLPDDEQAKARKIAPLGSNYANVLGTSHTTVMDMANAYATIASQGTRATPYFIRTVKGGPGNLEYTAKPAKKVAFDKDVTADVIDAMEQPVKDGTAEYARRLDRPVAGKTGTTTDNKAAWFDGFTPQLSTAVGVYSTGKNGEELSMNNVAGVGELTGGTVPLKIWTDYMGTALKGQKVLEFPKRAGVGDDDLPPPPPPTTTTTTSSTTTTTTSSSTTTSQPTTTTSSSSSTSSDSSSSSSSSTKPTSSSSSKSSTSTTPAERRRATSTSGP